MGPSGKVKLSSEHYNIKQDEANLKSEQEKTAQVQKLAIIKKSTIFVQSFWNLVKMITSWGNHVHQVSS